MVIALWESYSHYTPCCVKIAVQICSTHLFSRHEFNYTKNLSIVILAKKWGSKTLKKRVNQN